MLVSLLGVLLAGGGGPSEQKTTAPASFSSPRSSLFIGGLGYCGIRIANTFHESFPDCRISGCVRSQERKQQMELDCPSWLNVHVLDLDDSYVGLDKDGLSDLVSATHVIQTVAPVADFDRDPILALHGDDLRHSASSGTLKWVGYISSTGVYGDHGGEWVDEESELRCVDSKSLARIRAEEEWRAFEELGRDGDTRPRIDCFRCGGIYGPGRSMITSVFKEQNNEIGNMSRSTANPSTEIPNDGKALTPKYVNRILVDDICGALLAAATNSKLKQVDGGGKVFNLVDNDPAPREYVGAEARRLVGLPAPSSAQRSGRRTTRNTGNKRCRNQRLKDEYGWEPIAPTYREGLAKLLDYEKIR